MHPFHFIRNRKLLLLVSLVVGTLLLSVLVVTAQGPNPGQTSHATSFLGTVFTYQGQLKKNGNPVNDTCNMAFSLWDSQGTGSPPTGGTQIGNTQSMGVTVTNGLFTVQVTNISHSVFTGDDRWLQAAVTCTGDNSAVTLTRQPVTAVPYAFSLIPGAEIIGYASTGLDVENQQPGGTGLRGAAETIGVEGYSPSYFGVRGSTGSIYGAGVVASSSIVSGTALEIFGGGIKVDHAGGFGSNTFAFVHRSTDANRTANTTLISNALTNGDPSAMLFVTHVNGPTGGPINGFNRAFGVIYRSGSSQWAIYAEDPADMPADVTFNVMVIKR